MALRDQPQTLRPSSAESVDSFRLLAENLPHLIWTAQPDGRVEYVNQRWIDFTGLQLAENGKWSWEQVLHPDDLDEFLNQWSQGVAHTAAKQFEVRLRHRQGSYRWFLVRMEPVSTQQQPRCFWIGTCTDIHDFSLRRKNDQHREESGSTDGAPTPGASEPAQQKNVEQAVLESQRRLQLVSDNVPALISYINRDGYYLFNNAYYREWFGEKAEDVAGRHVRDVLGEEVYRHREPYIKRVMQGETVRFEGPLQHQNLGLRHIQLAYVPDTSESGTVEGFYVMAFDVTELKQAEVTLRESEERLALALEAGSMGTWEWHIPTNKVIWSSTLEVIHGIPQGSFAGTFEAFQQDIHPEDRDRALTQIRDAVEKQRDHYLEYRIIRPDGSVRWLEARGKLLTDEEGSPQRLTGVCSDVTNRKELEQQLQRQVEELAEAEVRTRSVVDNVIDGIITIDEQGLINSFNPAAERIFGYTASEVSGKNVRVLMPEPYQSEHDEYLLNYLRTGEAKIIGIGREVMGKRKEGTEFPLDLAVGEFHHGGQRFFTGVVRDITERKRIEHALRFLAEASKSLASLVDHRSTLQLVARLAVPDFADWCAVDLLDDDGTLQRLAVSHVDPSKIELAEELQQHFPKPDAPRGVMKVLRTGESELVSEITDSMLIEAAPDEKYLNLLRQLGLKSYICTPLKTKDQVFGAISFVSAESGRSYGPEDLAMAVDLAHRAAIAIENACLYQELREADRRKDEFLAMLAHELRNPLAPIRSGLDLLAMETDSDQETLHLMQEQVEHVVRLVDDLLDVSRIMRGKIELRKEPVELGALITRSVNAVQSLIDSHQQELKISEAATPIWLDVDPVRLVQVFENLLNNASKYTYFGGRINLVATQENQQAVIRVQDTGVGIDPELLPRVFELFAQSSRSLDRAEGGLGIGLTLVQRLVEMHGGSVAAHSDGPGHGSIFEVRLPILQSAPPPVETKKTSPVVRSRRILVVDDYAGAARLLSKLLEKLGDHQVEVAHDGPAALETIKATHPEIVFLDIGLPGMDGHQVGKAIRDQPEFNDVLLVALTGYGQTEDRQRSQEAGFDEHLVKPPSVAQIESILAHPKLKR